VFRDDVGSDCLIDILAANGDLIETFFCAKAAFRYLLRVLKIRVETSEKERG
jgi:hypothetical protein